MRVSISAYTNGLHGLPQWLRSDMISPLRLNTSVDVTSDQDVGRLLVATFNVPSSVKVVLEAGGCVATIQDWMVVDKDDDGLPLRMGRLGFALSFEGTRDGGKIFVHLVDPQDRTCNLAASISARERAAA